MDDGKWQGWTPFRDWVFDHLNGVELTTDDEETFSGKIQAFAPGFRSMVSSKATGRRTANRTMASVRSRPSDTVSIVVVQSGQIAIEIGGEVMVAQSGDFLISDSALPHRLYLEPARGAVSDANLLRLQRSSVSTISLPSLSSGKFVFDGTEPSSRVLQAFLASFFDAAEDLDEAGARAFENAAAQLLTNLLELSGTELTAKSQAALTRVTGELTSRVRDPCLRLEDVASELGISPRSRQRLFQGIGATPSQWLETRRLEMIATELRSSRHANRSVTQIALSCGYNNLSHFSRVFKRRYGVSPSVYRKG
jgi:AraC-like DNA-binding protein